MHLYTIIQLIILAALWTVKSTKGSLGFPFLLILCIPFRKFILPYIFKKEELDQVRIFFARSPNVVTRKPHAPLSCFPAAVSTADITADKTIYST